MSDEGWDIDEWGLTDLQPDEDDALPLYRRKSRIPAMNRNAARLPKRGAQPSIFSIPAPSRATLPPPALSPSVTPAVRYSIAGMMLGEPRTSLAAASATFDGHREVRKATDDIRMPRSLRPRKDADEEAGTSAREELSQKTISDIMDVIYRSESRDEIISSTLDFLLLFARRAGFILVKKDEIRGFALKGEASNPTAFKSYWIPADADSTFKKVADEKQIHLGPFGRSTSDAVFSAALGGRPLRVLVIPVVIHDKVAGLLYADNLRIDMPPWNLLERIAEVTGRSLYRLLQHRRTV